WESLRARGGWRGRGRARRGLMRWVQRLEKPDQRVHFGRREVLAVGGHVAAALQHLPDQLIAREPRRNAIERGTARPAFTAQAVAVPALFVLHHERALQLERRPALHISNRRGERGPGV